MNNHDSTIQKIRKTSGGRFAATRPNGVVDILRVAAPHAEARMFNGGLGCLVMVAIRDGETPEEAINREYGHWSCERGPAYLVEWV